MDTPNEDATGTTIITKTSIWDISDPIVQLKLYDGGNPEDGCYTHRSPREKKEVTGDTKPDEHN
jgi:hypothetical protein